MLGPTWGITERLATMADTNATEKADAYTTLETLEPDDLTELIKTALGVCGALQGMTYWLSEMNLAPQAEACELLSTSLWDAVRRIVPSPNKSNGSYVR